MTAVAAARNTLKYNTEVCPELISVPVAASTHVYQGALVGLDANGRAVSGTSNATARILGMATEDADNSTGSAGAINVQVRQGVYYFANSSSTDAIVAADVSRFCYVVDDQTVARSSGNGARLRAGVVIAVDSTDGVAVWIGAPCELNAPCELEILAGEDLSSYQYSGVKVNNAGALVRAGAGEFACGILQNAPANGAMGIVRIAGVSVMKADGTGVTRGDKVSCAANGLGRSTAAAASGTAHVNTSDAGAATDPVIGAAVLGVALTTAAAGANFNVLITHSGAVATTAF